MRLPSITIQAILVAIAAIQVACVLGVSTRTGTFVSIVPPAKSATEVNDDRALDKRSVAVPDEEALQKLAKRAVAGNWLFKFGRLAKRTMAGDELKLRKRTVTSPDEISAQPDALNKLAKRRVAGEWLFKIIKPLEYIVALTRKIGGSKLTKRTVAGGELKLRKRTVSSADEISAERGAPNKLAKRRVAGE